MRDLLEKALRIQEREYGAEHRLVATTLTNLGIADGEQGDAQKYYCEDDEVAAVACDTSSGIAKAGVAGDRCHTVFPSRQVAEGGDSIDLVWHGGRQK